MKKIVSLLLALLLAAAIPMSALADAVLEGSRTYRRAQIIVEANTYIAYKNNAYGLYDHDSNLISELYAYAEEEGPFAEVVSDTDTLNSRGLIDATTGELVLPMKYGDLKAVNEDWVAAITLTPTSSSNYDYYVSNHGNCNISSVDIVYKGKVVATLSPAECNSHYLYAYGAYFGTRISQNHMLWIDADGNRTSDTSDYASSDEFKSVYGKGILHNPSQQYAFNSSCTLKASDVKQSVWYNSIGNFVDLQGNTISEGPAAYKEYDSARYAGSSYMTLRTNGKYGIADMQGNEVLPAVYAALGGDSWADSYFASGYQAVLDDEGRLSYLKQDGSVTIATPYTLSSSYHYKGFSCNAPIIAVENMGTFLIITATHGVLETTYKDIRSVSYPTQRLISVKKGDAWGCIDMSGNVVVPFTHPYSLEISSDGTLAFGSLSNGQEVIYAIGYTDPLPTFNDTVVPETPALSEGEWLCACGRVNTSKFCPDCGEPKPIEEIKCSGCGYEPEDETPNFCPDCGKKF